MKQTTQQILLLLLKNSLKDGAYYICPNYSVKRDSIYSDYQALAGNEFVNSSGPFLRSCAQ